MTGDQLLISVKSGT